MYRRTRTRGAIHSGALECGFGLGHALDGSDGHVMAPFRWESCEYTPQMVRLTADLAFVPGFSWTDTTEHCLEY